MTNRWRRVLLTGAAGNLGRNLRKHLGDVAGELVVTDRVDMGFRRGPRDGRHMRASGVSEGESDGLRG